MTTRSFISLVGIEPDQDITRTAVALVRAGYAVIPIEPGAKTPLCTLTARDRVKADRAAEAEGRRRHECGVKHAITDDTVARRVFARLAKGYEGQRLNIALVTGPSGIVTVDADTLAEVEALRAAWATAEDDPGYLGHSPTVSTPGVLEGDVWRHKSGGHWHFLIPDDVVLDDVPASIKMPGGWVIMTGDSYALIPPSVRPEGAYVPHGDIVTAPGFILDALRDAGRARAARLDASSTFTGDDAVATWSTSVSWDELLVEAGWTTSGRVEKCGCPVWAKPGKPSTEKSAVAHANDCPDFANVEGHGPLKVWAEHAFDVVDGQGAQPTLTKLTFLAHTQHDGDVGAAMSAVGIGTLSEDVATWLDDESQRESQVNPSPVDDDSDDAPASNPESQSHLSRDSGIGHIGDSDDALPNPSLESQPSVSFWLPEDDQPTRQAIQNKAKERYIHERGIEYLNHRRGLNGPSMLVTTPSLIDAGEAVVPDVATRSDGVYLLYRSRVNTVFGPSEAGKSWFSMACLQSVINAGGRVLVIDMEDDEGGFTSRLKVIGITRAQEALITYVRPWGMITAAERGIIEQAARGVDLIVVDSLDAYMALQGQDSNHAVSIRAAGAWLKSLAHSTSAAVLLVDHASEKGDGPARMQLGSSAKKQFIDGTTLRADRITLWRPGASCRTMLMAGKDRHGWAKTHAAFKSESSDWGRLVELTMSPDIGPAGEWLSRLAMRVPPTYSEESGTSEADLLAVEDRIIDFLRSKTGQWQPRTELYKAAGDKNGRGYEPEAVARLVELRIIDHRELPTRGGRVSNEYRYPDEDPESLNP